MTKTVSRSGRNRARRLAMQASYQSLLTDHSFATIRSQFRDLGYTDGADKRYFAALLKEIAAGRGKYDELIARLADRPVTQIDPVEHAVLLVALAELTARVDVPYRVVIDEAIGMARRYGGTESHKYVNAIVDRAARELREAEYGKSR